MDVFAALADPVRRDLMTRLTHGSVRVVDLAEAHAISRPAISRHLRVLLEAELISVEDRGRERHYRVSPAGLAPVRRFLETLEPAPDAAELPVRLAADVLDGLELEVRRTVREHHSDQHHPDQHHPDQHHPGADAQEESA